METYGQVIAELDALVDEFTLLKRASSDHVDDQLTSGIDSFLKEKLGDAYSSEGEYVWYAMVIKYCSIYGKEEGVSSNTNTLNKYIQELKDKYQ